MSFVSVTQDFNTGTSMGRLTLHILLSFAQFEREIISERTRDKLSAARRKGKWIGGIPDACQTAVELEVLEASFVFRTSLSSEQLSDADMITCQVSVELTA